MEPPRKAQPAPGLDPQVAAVEAPEDHGLAAKRACESRDINAAAQLLVGVDAELANPYDGQRCATTALDPSRERETQAGRGPSRSVQDSLILTDRRERAPTPASRSSRTGAGRGPYVISKHCPQQPVANQGVGRMFTIPLRSHGAWSSRLQSAHLRPNRPVSHGPDCFFEYRMV